jgi:hypothetical protein
MRMCIALAVQHGDEFGVLGGLDPLADDRQHQGEIIFDHGGGIEPKAGERLAPDQPVRSW